METTKEFSFGDNSVAASYDDVLVPILFAPWAERLAMEHGPWTGRRVLDLATGTGIVAQLLAREVGSDGTVVGTDINNEMLQVARKRCADSPKAIEFVECPAHGINMEDESVDTVVCQQGFQFFPDRLGAAREIFRVLRPGGQLIASTWRPVDECEFFGCICNALEIIGRGDLSILMRVPFDLMPESNFVDELHAAGFSDISKEYQEQDLLIAGGIAEAVSVSYATPIGPKLRQLDAETQSRFRDAMSLQLRGISRDGVCMGRMVTSVFTARKRW